MNWSFQVIRTHGTICNLLRYLLIVSKLEVFDHFLLDHLRIDFLKTILLVYSKNYTKQPIEILCSHNIKRSQVLVENCKVWLFSTHTQIAPKRHFDFRHTFRIKVRIDWTLIFRNLKIFDVLLNYITKTEGPHSKPLI